VTTKSQRARLFEAARAVAAALVDDFHGNVEIHIFNGSVGSVKVNQTLRNADCKEGGIDR